MKRTLVFAIALCAMVGLLVTTASAAPPEAKKKIAYPVNDFSATTPALMLSADGTYFMLINRSFTDAMPARSTKPFTPCGPRSTPTPDF